MKDLFYGKNQIRFGPEKVHGRPAILDGEEFYCIENFDRLRPFLLSIVSCSDLWMFVSTTGGLTAGRRDPDSAVFPYYTEDKIRDNFENTGPKTILIIDTRAGRQLWEPFSERGLGLYRIRRNLYKNFRGNKIVFEETNEDLGLAFRYSWSPSHQFGWVRKSCLSSSVAADVHLLDGLQNLLPCGIGSQFQLEKSVLVDAYKKSELLPDCGLGLFLLSSIPVDRPEPAESLRATVAWSAGIPRNCVLLSSLQLHNFRRGGRLQPEMDIRAEPGAYFVESEFTLQPGQKREWIIAADVEQGPSQVADLRRQLRSSTSLQRKVAINIAEESQEIWCIVARADGLQKSARPLGDARHFANVLFNVMRGGIFPAEYRIDVADLHSFIKQANQAVAAKQKRFLGKLGQTVLRNRLLELVRESGDPNLERLCHEYLPLTFSRRHGDPSRPWNRFSIAARGALNYEGNWRDIFQNWEALAVSFPGFVSGMICKFVDASTADGYNPYRITRDGFDWEVHDPEDPWSHIGYWGDHQIIYLLRLVEILERHDPAALRDLLTREIFSFANVPYKIKPYADLLRDPRDTVEFDSSRDKLARERVRQIGADGKLVWDKQNRVIHVNFAEKLLIPILAKLANFVPGAGVWLNTQRPEWNDANNALVGNGASMVTVYQLHRHLAFWLELFESLEETELSLSIEVAQWLSATSKALVEYDSRSPRQLLNALGAAAEKYRRAIYSGGFSGRKIKIATGEWIEFFETALFGIERTIRANKRKDGLYHSYNLIDWKDGGITVRRLPEMLEGQAAILGAKFLSANESAELLSALKQSALYRPDQHSYLLFPDRQLARFEKKNNFGAATAARIPLLRQLLGDNNRALLERDASGVCHFNSQIANARDVKQILQALSAGGHAKLVQRDAEKVLALFEKLFDHRAFTGRSGTFFGYEGLGCIYWHMVSKLLLAVQESSNEKRAYYEEIRAGIGDVKTPESYGAFPMDPYSHTPAQGGARQPGLTGQVKEDILCRFGELGLSVSGGRIHFEPQLLRKEEFLPGPAEFNYLNLAGQMRIIRLKAQTLAFTYCQVPIVYQLTREPFLEITFANGRRSRQRSLIVADDISGSIFDRAGSVKSMLVGVNEKQL